MSFGSGVVLTRTSDGVPMHVFGDDLIGRHIIISGKFDRSLVQLLLKRARRGDVLVDIGANVGYVSATFLQNIPESCAICFEPQPGIKDLLERNLAPFGNRVEINSVGLSNADGVLQFCVNTENRGASRLDPQDETRVPVLHAGVALARFDRVDFIKIDVEGHEEAIFSAITSELARLRPRGILFESIGGLSADDRIARLLISSGYNIFAARKELLRTRLVRVGLQRKERANDFLALLSSG